MARDIDNCYDNLAKAIVLQAVMDYIYPKAAVKKWDSSVRNEKSYQERVKKNKEKAREFLLSPETEYLSGLKGEMIINKIDRGEITLNAKAFTYGRGDYDYD